MTPGWTLTFWQRGLALAVEHDVDTREGNISEESRHQAREQSCRTFSPTHTAQSPGHTHITVLSTLKVENTTHVKFSMHITQLSNYIAENTLYYSFILHFDV